MKTITTAREALAAALSAIDGLAVRPRPGLKNPRPGDGWIIAGKITPAGYTDATVVLTAVIVLGQDQASAEDLYETWAVDALDTATKITDMPVADAAAEPGTLPTEGAPLYGFTITLTTEVEQ